MINKISKHNFICFLPLLILALLITGCQHSNSRQAVYKPPVRPQVTGNQKQVNSILKTAFSQMGTPYRYGGNTPETGFDCSGFVNWVYRQYGVSLPRSSRDMLGVGIPIEREELRPGDLVFFNYGYSHVGIYTGNDSYIHSPRTGKSIEEVKLSGTGRGSRFVGARRIINNQGVEDSISARLKEEWISQSRHQATLAMNDSAAKKHTGAVAYRGPAKTKTMARHKVIPGETLSTIAQRYGIKTSDLVSNNRMKNQNQLKPGQTLVIPQKKAQQTKAITKAKTGQTEKIQAKAKIAGKVKHLKAKSNSKAKVATKARSKAKAKAKAKGGPTPPKVSTAKP